MTDHDKRVYHHMYETNEGIAEHAERIAKLEELCEVMHGQIKEVCSVCDGDYCLNWDDDGECCVFDTYMRELGLVRE